MAKKSKEKLGESVVAQEVKLDKFHLHEAMDRLWCLGETYENTINTHPLITQNKKFKKKSNQIQWKLWSLYQELAKKKFSQIKKQ